MMLNRDQIVARGLISQQCADGSLRDAGYDLRIASLIGKTDDGRSEKKVDEHYLKPQGVALVVSKEVVRLPPDVCAHASVKTSLCREGVPAINIGIIDPGWEGPISSVLLNFGKESYRLKNDEPFLRLTFHALESPVGFSASAPRDPATYAHRPSVGPSRSRSCAALQSNAGVMRPARASNCRGDAEDKAGSGDISRRVYRIALLLPAIPSQLLPHRHLLSRAYAFPSKPKFVALERGADRRPWSNSNVNRHCPNTWRS